MKKILIAFAGALMSLIVMGYETWTDPKTGIEWKYTIHNGTASVGSGNYRTAAIPASTIGTIAVPSVLGECPTKEIGGYAFYGCNALTNVDIPDGVLNIEHCAFQDCIGLVSVAIPESVSNIENYAFKNCNILKNVNIPNKVSKISEGIFMDCSGLENLKIPDCVKTIDTYAFDGCSGLTSIDIPLCVTNIGPRAFANCSKLTRLTIPLGVKTISNFMLVNCNSLTNVAISTTVTNIGSYAFKGCSALPNIIIPNSIAAIGGYGFWQCSNLCCVDFEGMPPDGVADANLKTDAAIRYNVAYYDEWQPVIEACGFTNATPYSPSQKGGVVFVVPHGKASVLSYVYTNEFYGVLPEARRDGCTFAGWYTSLDGTNRVSAFSAVDASVTALYARWVEEDASLYAQWDANAYSINFNANGGDGAMADQSFLYDQAQALNGSTFTKLGYTFKGWATDPDGEVVYADKASVSNLTAEAGFAVALFAKWESIMDVAAEEIEDWVGYDLAPKFKKEGETKSQYRKRFEDKFGDSYLAAFYKETGKVGMDGTKLCVWHDYVAGTDPLDETSQFTATITFDDKGVPKVEYKPEFDDPEEAAKRAYTTYGKKNLSDEKWSVVDGNEADYNFFMVTVEMKPQD